MLFDKNIQFPGIHIFQTVNFNFKNRYNGFQLDSTSIIAGDFKSESLQHFPDSPSLNFPDSPSLNFP